jgi:hypothetical protein
MLFTIGNGCRYLNELSKSSYDNPELWRNNDLGTYLEAIANWTNDMEGYYKNQSLPVPENLNWQLMSRMLSAARFYD